MGSSGLTSNRRRIRRITVRHLATIFPGKLRVTPPVHELAASVQRLPRQQRNAADHRPGGSGTQIATRAPSRGSVHLLCSASQPLPPILFLRLATCMALNCDSVNVAFRFFIIPLLIFAFPYFALPAFAAGEWPVEVKIGKAPVSIDVRELAVIGCHSRGMISLLSGTETQHSFCFA